MDANFFVVFNPQEGHKGASTNRFRPPIKYLFREGGSRGLAFESAFKKKIRTKPELVLTLRAYLCTSSMTAPTNCTDFMFKFVAFSQEIHEFYGKRYFISLNFASCFIKINILHLNI